jgi:hypothetical protein
MRAYVRLERRRGGRLRVRVGGTQSFWRKRVLIQRFDRRIGQWVAARTVPLTDTEGGRYAVPVIFSLTQPFRLAVSRGTLVRAVLPRTVARPCYVAGYSQLVRTVG